MTIRRALLRPSNGGVSACSTGSGAPQEDNDEIRALLAPSVQVCEMFTVTPIAHKLPLRLVTAPMVRKMIPGLTRWEEKRGWGWMIMVLAQKRA